MSQPAKDYVRPATCAEVECHAHVNGWATALNPLDPDHAPKIYYIRNQSGRSFTEELVAPDRLVFSFTAGQPCFRAGEHKVRTGKPEVWVVRGGDFRGNPRRERRLHKSADDWVDDFANHQDKLATRYQQG